MDRADLGMTERIGPRVKVAAPILERHRTAENQHIATIDDLDAPADLVAVFAVVETVPRNCGRARILVNADAQVGNVLVGNRHDVLPSLARSGARRLVLASAGVPDVVADVAIYPIVNLQSVCAAGREAAHIFPPLSKKWNSRRHWRSGIAGRPNMRYVVCRGKHALSAACEALRGPPC